MCTIQVLLSSLRNTEIVEIMAGALEAIMLAQMQVQTCFVAVCCTVLQHTATRYSIYE